MLILTLSCGTYQFMLDIPHDSASIKIESNYYPFYTILWIMYMTNIKQKPVDIKIRKVYWEKNYRYIVTISSKQGHSL